MSTYDLDAIVDQRREAVGGDDVTFSFAGTEFSFPHPLLAADEWKTGLEDISGDVEFGEYVLGDQYDKFVELGGRSAYLALLMEQIRREAQDEDRDGRPTRLSASSRAQRRRQKQT